ncbi:unnamed protein product [Lampetra planeri]
MVIDSRDWERKGWDGAESQVCQFTECISVKTKCEEPLNQYLTPEETCKGKRYASARKQCFQSIYKKKIEAIAKKQLNLRSIPDRVLASLREFQLEHCAYVAKDFPHYCETMECTKEVDACGMQNRNLIEEENGPDMGLIAGVVGGLLVAIIAVACVVLFIKKRSQSRAPGSAEDVEHATNTLSLCNVYFAWMHLATLNEDTSSPSAGRMCSSQLRSIQHCSSELPSSKLRRSELRSIELDSSELRSRIMLCSLTR